MRNKFRGNLVLVALKKETFETAKETFLLPFLEFREIFFCCDFRNFAIKYYMKICLVIIIIFLLSSNTKQKKPEQEKFIT